MSGNNYLLFAFMSKAQSNLKHILQILLAKLTIIFYYTKSIVCFSRFACKICLFLDLYEV